MSLQEGVTYWKLRLLTDAFEKIVIPDEPKPGISASTKKVVKQLLAEAILPFGSAEVNNGCRPGSAQQEQPQCDGDLSLELLDKKTLVLLSKWVKIEINKLGDEVVGVYKQKLEGSEDEHDKELLKALSSVSNPLDAISDHILRETKEEASLDLEIAKWTKVRDSEMEACRSDIVEVNQGLSGFKQDVTKGKYAEVMKQYADFVKLESEYLQRKQKLTHMRQKIAENPPDVTNELHQAYKALLDARDKVEEVIKDRQSKKAKYEALGPEFQELLANWKQYGELIQHKDFVLNKMNSTGNGGDLSFNLSLNSSMLDSPH